MEGKRVVVTGIGVISPVGLDVPTMWQNLTCGHSGIGPITLFDTRDYEVRIAGEVRGFDSLNYMSPKEARRVDRFTHFAIAALQEALDQSRFMIEASFAFDVGVNIGSAAGGVLTYTGEFEVLREKGPRKVSPFLGPSITVDVAAVQVALKTGARGPNYGVASACATGADAIGQAFDLIRQGQVRAMFTGGFEAMVAPITIATFSRMQALSRRNDDPAGASRPFDADRDGFVMSEGGALLVLEDLDFALQRGAEPLAEVIGYASTSDAVHIASPDAEGTGAAQSMQRAMQRAGVSQAQVDYINAHGTGTRLGDPAETRAIKQVFGEAAYRVPVSSTKSMTGHLSGGAGAFEAVVCIQALRHGIIPPTINLHTPDPECDLDYVPLQARPADLDIVMTNSFGFGGHNATLVLKAFR
jgi:beta-ketoacyl-acyl-carrier-protein synthase II